MVSREAFAAPNVAFDFAEAFAHLDIVQKSVIFDLELNHEQSITPAQLMHIVKNDICDFIRGFRKSSLDGGVGSRVDSGFRELSHPLEWRGY